MKNCKKRKVYSSQAEGVSRQRRLLVMARCIASYLGRSGVGKDGVLANYRDEYVTIIYRITLTNTGFCSSSTMITIHSPGTFAKLVLEEKNGVIYCPAHQERWEREWEEGLRARYSEAIITKKRIQEKIKKIDEIGALERRVRKQKLITSKIG